jgi:hypothetical protein
MNQKIDWHMVLRLSLMLVGVSVGAFLLSWGGGLAPMAALKAAALAAGGWLVGHLQNKGQVMPSFDCFQKPVAPAPTIPPEREP